MVGPELAQGEDGCEAIRDPNLDALCSGLPPADARDLREERAAILEHLAGLTRPDADRRAGVVSTGGASG
jgi:hypothetical protein